MIACLPVVGIGEVRAGDDLSDLVLGATPLHDGEIVVVTSKVVSKAEGRVATGDRAAAIEGETDRIVARRGPTTIVRTRHGFVMAAAGIDASNTDPGTIVLLPVDPDASARRLREAIAARSGANVAVVVSDTSGRAWRAGQTDIAVGAAGLDALDDHAGRVDDYGNLLSVTAPAVADEITAAADLVTGKLSRWPAAVVRGLEHLVLPPGQHGTGAAALVRAEEQDMFGLGSREAVLSALVRDDPRGFGAPAPVEEVCQVLAEVVPSARMESSPEGRLVTVHPEPELDARALGSLEERVTTAAFALGWRRVSRPRRPGSAGAAFGFAPDGP